jgi:hypothetical protein
MPDLTPQKKAITYKLQLKMESKKIPNREAPEVCLLKWKCMKHLSQVYQHLG